MYVCMYVCMYVAQKSTFPNESGGEMRATDKIIQKNQSTAKKNRKSDIQLQNGGKKKKKKKKKPISISRHISHQKMGKPLSRRNFSLKFGS